MGSEMCIRDRLLISIPLAGAAFTSNLWRTRRSKIIKAVVGCVSLAVVGALVVLLVGVTDDPNTGTIYQSVMSNEELESSSRNLFMASVVLAFSTAWQDAADSIRATENT